MKGRKIVILVLVGVFLANVSIAAGQNKCFPQWAETPIAIDKEMKRIEFARGDTFTIEGNYGSARDCAYQFRWEVLINGVPSNAIIIKDIHAKKTTAVVGASAKSGDAVAVRGVFTFLNDTTGARNEKEAKIAIVDRPGPPVINLVYGQIKSFTRFSVDWSESKAQGSSNNFVYNCSFVLKDEQGNIVDRKEAKADREKARPLVWLTPKNSGIYSLTTVCGDSHLVLATITESVPVGMGDSKRNAPYLIVNKTMRCYLGKDCVIDFSRTNDFGKSLSVEYYDITNGDNKNVPAIPCGTQACKLNFTKPGVYKIKLVARFLLGNDGNKFIYSDPSETIIQVVVSQQPQAQQGITKPARQVQPAAAATAPASTAVSGDDCAGYRCKSAPGIGGFAVIFALVILARRIKK